MNKLILSLGITLLFISCGNNKADQPVTNDDTADATEPVYIWQAGLNDSTGDLEMSKVISEGADISSAQTIITTINERNPEIKLEYVKTSNDTVYLKIADAHHLTQQMGSTGPMLYLSALIYNLTELPGIRFVRLDFEEGDHAQPGTFSRDTFKDE